MNYKLIIAVIASLVIGLGLGYFLFGQQQNNPPAHKHATHPTSAPSTPAAAQIWTCSMDPQVRQNEPGDCPICGMDLIPLDEMTQAAGPNVFQMTKEAVKLANIQTTTVGMSATEAGALKLNGKIQADETKAASIVAHIPGRIEKLYLSFTGEQVSVGQRIATIYSPDLIAAQRELIEAKKIQDISPKLLEAARSKLHYWKIGAGTIDRILQSETVQEYFDIYAEHSGIVKNRKVSVGDHLRAGEVLFDIQSLTSVWVLFDVYEADLPKVKLHSKVRFETPSLPNKTFKATISFIDPVINPTTRVATIRAEVNNGSKRLKPAMFVTGSIYQAPSKSEQLTVPKTSVMWTGERSVAYVKVPNTQLPSFEFREIELGTALGNRYAVISGLERGEEVVTNGAFVIDASAQLNNQASMMNRNVQVKGALAGSDIPDYKESSPKAFQTQLNKVANAYFSLKDALVATDAQLAAKEAKKLRQQVEKVDMKLLKGDPHLYWMQQLTALKAHSNKITTLDDTEAQRTQFDFLSQAMINTLKAFGLGGEKLYVQHCPMAFDNQGADWLSKEEGIRNPYFGDKMMKCGKVTATLE